MDLTYESALEKARGIKSQINHCTEYSNAYAFDFDSGDDTQGGDAPVVILNSGKVMNLIDYAVTPNKKYIRDFKI